MASVVEPARAFLLRHRRRIAPIVLGVAVVVVGTPLLEAVPRETDVHLDFGADHLRVSSAEITFASDATAVHGVRLDYPDGAPRRVEHTADLPPGDYDVRIELRGPAFHRDLTRSLAVPAEGRVHFRLWDSASGDR